MASPDRKFLVAQYLDGTLSTRQRAQIEQQLANDPALRQFVQEELRLDGVLNAASPPPVVDWEELELRISAAVAAARDPVAHQRRPVVSAGAWMRAAAALAACVLIAVGISRRSHHAAAPVVDGEAAVVIGPQADPPPGGTQFAEVTLASPSFAEEYLAALDTSNQPSHVSISSATLH